MPELPPDEFRALVRQIAQAVGARPAAAPARSDIAAVMEHSLLRPDASAEEITRLCGEAAAWGCAAVCVNPAWVARAAAALRGTPVRVAATVGFPLGASTTTAKRAEAAECLKLGADDLDVVIALGALKSGADTLVRAELRGIVELAHAAGAQVKAILEMGLLTAGEKARVCALALEAGVDFVKTSTGFGDAGTAQLADVAQLRAAAEGRAGVKAAGGIRTLAQAQALLGAGATRLGTSHTAAILGELGQAG